jgi:hypothetical protein
MRALFYWASNFIGQATIDQQQCAVSRESDVPAADFQIKIESPESVDAAASLYC